MRFRLLQQAGLCFAILFLVSPAFTQTTAATVPQPFIPGETLTYNVTWSIFPAGQVVASVKQIGTGADDAYEIDAKARSSGFVSLLYNLDNHYRSVVDPRTLCSRSIDKTINEGRRHKQTHITFDGAQHVAILDERDTAKPNHPLKHAENAIPGCVEDIVTAFYYLRRQPMEVGDKIAIPVNDGSKTHDVVIDVQARQRLQTPLGPRYAFRLEPRALGDLYKKKGRMLIWMSDDPARLPLRIKAMMVVGTISGTLESVTYAHPTPPAAGQ
ncbi:MAG: DUF3108 domain-containing protein [Terriglobia bacterium]